MFVAWSSNWYCFDVDEEARGWPISSVLVIVIGRSLSYNKPEPACCYRRSDVYRVAIGALWCAYAIRSYMSDWVLFDCSVIPIFTVCIFIDQFNRCSQLTNTPQRQLTTVGLSTECLASLVCCQEVQCRLKQLDKLINRNHMLSKTYVQCAKSLIDWSIDRFLDRPSIPWNCSHWELCDILLPLYNHDQLTDWLFHWLLNWS